MSTSSHLTADYETTIHEPNYVLIQSAPSVPASEVEADDAIAVEVMISWGGNLLRVEHLSPARTFTLGHADPKTPVDFVIPSEKIGAERLPLVRVTDGEVWLVVPTTGTGTHRSKDGEEISLADAIGDTGTASSLAGCHELPLAFGTSASLTLDDFTFSVSVVRAGKRSPRSFLGASRTALVWFGATAASVAALLAVTAYLVPSLNGLGAGDDDQSQVYLIQQYMSALQERETEPEPQETADADSASEAGEGSRAPAEEGKAGSVTSQAANKKFAVQGPPDNPDPHLARERALAEASTFGLVSMLQQGALSGPVSVFGRDTALGQDEMSAEGNMWGDTLGEAAGTGGLGLAGIGEGSGGIAGVIGLGDIGFGHGAGSCDGGRCDGFGTSRGRLTGTHKTKTPSIGTVGETVISGRLPASTIQRIVRQNFGRMRMCYQDALSRNPNLEGRVAVRFVIGREGAVSNSQNGGSSLPDSAAVACVTRAFYGMSFPKPENGIVTVVYPIAFNPA